MCTKSDFNFFLLIIFELLFSLNNIKVIMRLLLNPRVIEYLYYHS